MELKKVEIMKLRKVRVIDEVRTPVVIDEAENSVVMIKFELNIVHRFNDLQ